MKLESPGLFPPGLLIYSPQKLFIYIMLKPVSKSNFWGDREQILTSFSWDFYDDDMDSHLKLLLNCKAFQAFR